MNTVNTFQAALEATPGFMDPSTQHHEFYQGDHGQKLDFSVVDRGSALYKRWINISKRKVIQRELPHKYIFLVGVADGMTDFGCDLAHAIQDTRYQGLKTEKLKSGLVRLTDAARFVIAEAARDNKVAVVVEEDVGTTGTTSGTVALECQDLGVDHSEVHNTYQRTPRLGFLEDNGIPNFYVIKNELPTYSPEVCASSGYCADGIRLIKRGESE